MQRIALSATILLFSVASAFSQNTSPDEMVKRIQSGSIDTNINTYVVEQATVHFALGYIKAADPDCGFDADIILANEVLATNYIYPILQKHLVFVDENGKDARTTSPTELVRRAGILSARLVVYQKTSEVKGREFFILQKKIAGCSGEQTKRFFSNAYALVTGGRLPYVSDPKFTTTLEETTYETGDAAMDCYYRLSPQDRYSIKQFQFAATKQNVKKFALGPINPEIRSLGGYQFMRSSCPANPDPWTESTRGKLKEKAFESKAASKAERMADYYLQILVEHKQNHKFATDTERDMIKDEIIKYESFAVAPEEVTREAKSFRDRFDGTMSCFFADNEIRRNRFIDKFGYAVRLDHLPHPHQKPGFKTIVVRGTAYLASPYNGRGEILNSLKLNWSWNGSSCVQPS
ncbi:hypothetical protein PMI07_003939 [Rhizobium sp. CF080]|uniref:hypothetical protein n=1 Tax=Rhizobium sp. (strain CF080) TaxID=1144310 RepID=UPI000271BD4C|nr:hypothetical protein [Rhizobium sp. CF080]EUC00653.1 hypothetical protein PMI07_003939 [Rhizobium sp. CF080]